MLKINDQNLRSKELMYGVSTIEDMVICLLNVLLQLVISHNYNVLLWWKTSCIELI